MLGFLRTASHYTKVVAVAVKNFWLSLRPNTRKMIYLPIVTLALGTAANVFALGLENLGPSLFGSVVGAVGVLAMTYFWPPKERAQ